MYLYINSYAASYQRKNSGVVVVQNLKWGSYVQPQKVRDFRTHPRGGRWRRRGRPCRGRWDYVADNVRLGKEEEEALRSEWGDDDDDDDFGGDRDEEDGTSDDDDDDEGGR